jgi:hypothetical protein
MSASLVYRTLIALRGCWLLIEWLFGWGAYSQVTTFTLTHPYAHLAAQAIAVAFWLAILLGMWFFQRWARWTFAILLAVALLTSPFRVQRYSLSSPPSFVAPVGVLMLLLTGAIVAMSFLPPVRGFFAMKEA